MLVHLIKAFDVDRLGLDFIFLGIFSFLYFYFPIFSLVDISQVNRDRSSLTKSFKDIQITHGK